MCILSVVGLCYNVTTQWRLIYSQFVAMNENIKHILKPINFMHLLLSIIDKPQIKYPSVVD